MLNCCGSEFRGVGVKADADVLGEGQEATHERCKLYSFVVYRMCTLGRLEKASSRHAALGVNKQLQNTRTDSGSIVDISAGLESGH